MNNLEEKKETQGKLKEYTIIVNGKEKIFVGDEISFDQVVELASGNASPDPNVIYTVTYKRGHGSKPEGSMVHGDTVKVKEGMIFNATPTSKS